MKTMLNITNELMVISCIALIPFLHYNLTTKTIHFCNRADAISRFPCPFPVSRDEESRSGKSRRQRLFLSGRARTLRYPERTHFPTASVAEFFRRLSLYETSGRTEKSHAIYAISFFVRPQSRMAVNRVSPSDAEFQGDRFHSESETDTFRALLRTSSFRPEKRKNALPTVAADHSHCLTSFH